MRTEILVSQQKEVSEIDTSIGEMAQAYSRTTGASLSEARQIVREMMSDVATRGQRQTPRSRPEHTPELAGDYDGEPDEPITRGIPRGTQNEKIPSQTKTEEHGPEKRSPDTNYGIYFENADAVRALADLAGVTQGEAMRLLSVGDEDVPAPRPYSRRGGRAGLYSSEELQDWAKGYKLRKQQRTKDKKQAREEDKTTARRPIPAIQPHFRPGMQASERFSDVDSGGDIDGVKAGLRCFGDAREHRRFRQESQTLSDDYFRSDSLGR